MTENRWRALVARRPLITFFVLANAVSWLGWAPYILSADGLGVLPYRLPELLGDTQLLGLMPGAYLGPLTAAFVVTAATEGREGLRQWRSRLVRFRVGWRWYAFTLLVFPAVLIAATLALPGGLGAFQLPGIEFLPMIVAYLVMQCLTSGLAEEPGWRDFALHRMQQRLHPLVATVVLGVLWAIWHFPLFLTAWGGGAQASVLVQFTLITIGLSIVISWIYNRAGNSLPMVILFHAAFNTVAGPGQRAFYPALDHQWSWSPVIGVWALAVVLLVATRGRLGYDATAVPRATAVPAHA
ncbi:CPBP family intramembrane glutamic endopeptidase [Pseudonocardia sp. TRM90224]|uniref:CPBP family intramembrane glutamic endopeptidase n=1 Tax=Pseudonocardia sp. TRM90224 TaxID=2812678 RepID=UPI001E3A311B|nr:CPBP family intramembrane glutamic endopeptidase [Pseudonocardia sp. TRM90224]